MSLPLVTDWYRTIMPNPVPHLTEENLALARVIGQRIKERRLQIKVGPGEISDKTGLGYKMINHLEQGIRLPSLIVLCRLATVLQTTPGVLLGTEPLPDPDKGKWARTRKIEPARPTTVDSAAE